MVGLKNRWLTERSSTVTCTVPTSPSAVPNPVMLRIIDDDPLGSESTVSIPELPSHAVGLRLSRQQIAREIRVALSQEVSKVPERHGAQDPDLEQRCERS